MKQLKIITPEPRPKESPNINDIKSVTIEHPKTSHKLSKTIRRLKSWCKKCCNSPLYCDTIKRENFLDNKNAKIVNQYLAYKCYVNSCNADIVNSFNLNSLIILNQQLEINL